MTSRICLDGFARKNADEDLDAAAAANPRNPRDRYRWGVMLAARSENEPGLDELIESVRLDQAFADGARRKAILAVIDNLGLESSITREYQRRLSRVLF